MLMASFLAILLVRGGVHHIASGTAFELDHPCFTIGIAVKRLGFVGKVLVDRGNFPASRGIDLGGGFHRFDRSDGFAGFDGVTFVYEDLDKDDIGELRLGVV